MHSATPKSPPCLIKLPTKFPIPNNKIWTQLKPRKKIQIQSSPKSVKLVISNLESSSSTLNQNIQNPNSLLFCSSVTAKKLQFLVSEFKSLPEPIDRVKKLLHYAGLLPPFDESARVESNRVRGCTTQVWLESRLDSDGQMRFRADSDSEITKGFCSCLIWVLDGAAPEEVVAVTAEYLVDVNVGFSGRAHSRVNTWHNVLTSMQKKTKALVEERESSPEQFTALVAVDDISANGSYGEAQTAQSWSRSIVLTAITRHLTSSKGLKFAHGWFTIAIAKIVNLICKC